MILIEKFARVNLLYDFYGPLLTERQRQVLRDHYARDLSLGEIAGALGITRQAVHDSVKRAVSALEDYERKLGLAERFLGERAGIAEALTLLHQLPVENNVTYRRLEQLLRELERSGLS